MVVMTLILMAAMFATTTTLAQLPTCENECVQQCLGVSNFKACVDECIEITCPRPTATVYTYLKGTLPGPALRLFTKIFLSSDMIIIFFISRYHELGDHILC